MAHLNEPQLAWIEPDEALPLPESVEPLPEHPGLIAAGRDLSAARLLEAYSAGIFPWFSEGQPVLWWSPDPRMCLKPTAFKLHSSLRKRIQTGLRSKRLRIAINEDFHSVITHCATRPRDGQQGTWIVPSMIEAYRAFNIAGYAHAVTAHWDGALVGGLYFVNIGGAVFGESMFSLATDGSKFALAALVAICRRESVALIDCQQETQHLASLGAQPISRQVFLQSLRQAKMREAIDLGFSEETWLTLDPRLTTHNRVS